MIKIRNKIAIYRWALTRERTTANFLTKYKSTILMQWERSMINFNQESKCPHETIFCLLSILSSHYTDCPSVKIFFSSPDSASSWKQNQVKMELIPTKWALQLYSLLPFHELVTFHYAVCKHTDWKLQSNQQTQFDAFINVHFSEGPLKSLGQHSKNLTDIACTQYLN